MSRRGKVWFFMGGNGFCLRVLALTITYLNSQYIVQEERKVEVLSAKLAELGVDAAALLAASSSDDKKASGGDDLT